MKWYLAINTFTPGYNGLGTVISAHRRLARAVRACQDAQPRERGSYLPCEVRGRSIRLTGIVHYRALEPVDGRELELAQDEVAYDRAVVGR